MLLGIYQVKPGSKKREKNGGSINQIKQVSGMTSAFIDGEKLKRIVK